MSDTTTSGGEQPVDHGRPGGDEAVVVVHAALVGVPGAYAASQSLAVTVIAAVLAVTLVAYLARRKSCGRRCTRCRGFVPNA